MDKPILLTRRGFLKAALVANAGLIIEVCLAGCRADGPDPEDATETPLAPTPLPVLEFSPDVYVKVGSDGWVTVTVHRSELGQGVRTALPMIVAEELDADWNRIRVEQAPADPTFGEQRTTGSRSVASAYNRLRRAGALARQILVGVAAQTWLVNPGECSVEQGVVLHPATGRSLDYGELVLLAQDAGTGELPDPTLKSPDAFQLIGTSPARLDDPRIARGAAVFGSDIRVPGMLYAVIARCPILGGRLDSFDATDALGVEGVVGVLRVETGVAVLATNTWAAIRGREALQIVWDEGEHSALRSEDLRRRFEPQASPGGAGLLEAVYDIPLLPHLTMEPMACTADVRSDRCEVWAPTQDPQTAKSYVAGITGLPPEAITVYVPLIGGAFGRRSQTDFVTEAVRLSQAIGQPVQVFWTRQDDLQHDFYHPLSSHLMRADLESVRLPRLIISEPDLAPIPTGIWRSVGNFPEAFVRECFLDEMAAALGRDPYELRMELEPEPLRRVVQAAAEAADWGAPLPAGWGRGLACHSTWGDTHVAQVAEVSVDSAGRVRVHRVVCAVDCGRVIHPRMVEAQMEGGIVFGLTAALKGEITVEGGRIQQTNFGDCPILRLDEMPAVEVVFVPSDRDPQGVGEMAVPPIAPALANAIFAATGRRVRRIPIRPSDILEA
jgi:isoquinoline 1-oxidoreductase beta subunit